MQGFSWPRKGKVLAKGSHSLHTQLMTWKRITSPLFSSLKGRQCSCPKLLWVRSLTYSLPSLGSRYSLHRINSPSLSSPNPLSRLPWVSPLWLLNSEGFTEICFWVHSYPLKQNISWLNYFSGDFRCLTEVPIHSKFGMMNRQRKSAKSANPRHGRVCSQILNCYSGTEIKGYRVPRCNVDPRVCSRYAFDGVYTSFHQ